MKKLLKKVMVVVFSGAVGFVNGFFGGGGGMLLVPLLEKAMKCPVKKSHATAIAIILPISIASAITYIINGYFDWTSVLSVSGGCVAGAGTLLPIEKAAAIVRNYTAQAEEKSATETKYEATLPLLLEDEEDAE